MTIKNTIYKPLVIWLFTGSFLVMLMVVIGGITRLTHSGLSIVHWDLIMGTLPPLNEAQWQETFEHYQQSPEFQKKNYHFELADFKSIFWWEYIHRLIGRLIGLIFLIPFLYFLFKGKIKGGLKKQLLIIFLLGGFQGFLGWFMVKSGLVDRPAVSHYRLAAHLVTALFLYVYIFWVALNVIYPEKRKLLGDYLKFKKFTVWLLVLVTVQIVYGAFVAGLKAGLILNTFPLMAGEIVHNSIGRAFANMGLAALTEDMVTVQFVHRYLAKILLIAGVFFWWQYRKKDISVSLKKSLNWMTIVFVGQFLLGVFTLLYAVPAWLGVLHQFGAIVLLTVLVYMLHGARGRVEV